MKLQDIYTVQSSDLVPDSDIMNGLTPGVTKITLRDVATMMVAVSDNSATNVLIDRVGMDNVNAMLRSLGKVLNQEMTADFFKVLSTHKSSFIPRGLPDDLKIANKPGELEGVRNDCGIVFVPNRPYGICVMTSYLRRERDGEDAISEISLAAYQMFDRISRASDYGRVISPGNSSK